MIGGPSPRVARRTLLALALGLTCAGASAALARLPHHRSAGSSGPEDPDDEALLAAWKRLGEEQRAEVINWLRAECERADTFQAALMRHLFGELDRDRYDWPVAPERAPLYDATRHAPGQPIERRFLPENARTAKRMRTKAFESVPPRRFEAAWTYDYATGSVLRSGDPDDLERHFANALAGIAPDLDLAEAIVARAPDDGSQRAVLAALAHAYADRKGRAYPGVTLYDAWSSGSTIEMPDVECLGIVHDVLDEWETWTAPIPASQHDALYATIKGLYVAARDHLARRQAFARTYLCSAPALRHGQGPNTDRLHAFWGRAGSDPAAMAAEFPPADKWKEWWTLQSRAISRSRELWEGGRTRRVTLERGEARVRSTLVWIMRELGAL